MMGDTSVLEFDKIYLNNIQGKLKIAQVGIGFKQDGKIITVGFDDIKKSNWLRVMRGVLNV